MYYSFESLFNKDAITYLHSLSEFLEDTRKVAKEKDLSPKDCYNKSFVKKDYFFPFNHGFLIPVVDNIELFFGIWEETWSVFSSPLCICIEGNMDSVFFKKSSLIFSEKISTEILFTETKTVEGYLAAGLKSEAIHQENSTTRIVEFIQNCRDTIIRSITP